jgi:outer membrane protein assembly factor BamB
MRRIRVLPVALAALLVSLGGASQGAAVAGEASHSAVKTKWPQFHGTLDNRGFNPREKKVGVENVWSLSLTWIGNGAKNGDDLVFASSPVFGNGSVFFGTADGQLLAFRAGGCRDSQCFPLWRAQLPQGVFSTPAVAHGVVYVATPGKVGALYAFDATGCGQQTCQPLWSAKVSAGESSPKVSGGLVYVGAAKGMAAFDAAGCGKDTCSPLWTGITGDSGVDDTPAVVDGVAYVGAEDGGLYAFDADGCGAHTCEALWRGRTGATIFSSSPAVADGVVYVGSFWDGRLNAFDADGCGKRNCHPLWKGDADQYLNSSPAVAYGQVYVGTGHGQLMSFDAAGCGSDLCQPKWVGQAAGPVAAMDGAPMVANGVVYVGENNGRIYAFDANGCGTQVCDKLWEHLTQDPLVNSSPAIIDGTLYVTGSNFGAVPMLYVFEAAFAD